MSDAAEWLSNDGPFVHLLAGFQQREQQLQLADAIADAIAERAQLIVEAGTGTGKTFAYLVPALLSGRKIIISTGTKNLQDQLFERDLPLVRKALGTGTQVALLKGRANYLCRYRLHRAMEEGRYRSREQSRQVQRIHTWSLSTRTGDRAEVDTIPDDAPVWRSVTANADNCLGQECEEWDRCYLLQARRDALKADLVVINHHLLFADVSLKDEGFGELLPGADAFIIDEAHHLGRVAQSFFGKTVSARQILELVRDAEAEQSVHAPDTPDLLPLMRGVEGACREFRLLLGQGDRKDGWHRVSGHQGVKDGVANLREHLQSMGNGFATVAERAKGLAACSLRAAQFAAQLATFIDEADEEQVCWFETRETGFWLHTTPLDVSGPFRDYRDAHPAAWVFTSATLAVADKFDHFRNEMGLEDSSDAAFISPFDFETQALTYLPPGLPQPNHPEYTRRVVERALPVIDATTGGVFFLFTSYRALREAAEMLATRTSRTILIQGTATRSSLLNLFRSEGDALLLATSSFWEGVDVRGAALSCVIIDKLPFAAPSEPVLQAQLNAIRKQGGNPFGEVQLPQAVIALKQGVGRLIRDVTDRGVVMLCDPRLRSKSYGRVFMQSLPPMPVTSDIADVEAFFTRDRSHGLAATGSGQ
jgi:ATP-dependent DNA helicase DinG